MSRRRFAADAGMLADVAAALHAGSTWREISAAVGGGVREVRAFYRPRVRGRLLRLLAAEPTVIEVPGLPHGSAGRYSHERACYADGRRCDPCTAAKNDHQARWRDEVDGRVPPPPSDEASLRLLAKRLHAGEGWAELADAAGYTLAYYRQVLRPLVQPFCLELIEWEDPPRPGEPAHGTLSRYIDGRWACHCEPCTYSRAVYEARRARKAARGLVPYVPAGPARAHLAALAAAGVGLKQVAKISGVSRGALAKLVYGGGSTPATIWRHAVAETAAELHVPADRITRAGVARTDWRVARAIALAAACRFMRRADGAGGGLVAAVEALAEVAGVSASAVYHARRSAAAAVADDPALELALTRIVARVRARSQPPSPPSPRVRAATANAILAVQPSDRAGGARVDAAATWARVDALVANGWTRKAIAAHLGQTTGGLQLGGRQVTVRKAEAIRRLYLDQPNPPASARRRSRWQQDGTMDTPTPEHDGGRPWT